MVTGFSISVDGRQRETYESQMKSNFAGDWGSQRCPDCSHVAPATRLL